MEMLSTVFRQCGIASFAISFLCSTSLNAEETSVGAPAPTATPQIELTSPNAAPKVAAPAEPKVLASGKLKDFDWRLSKVKVTGAILTVEFEVNSEKGSGAYLPAGQISYIDDATAKKYGVLKDEGGQYMMAPLFGKDELLMGGTQGISKTWIKFPAPPAGSKTVSLNIPSVGALDGVEVQR
jgi:hypothetical protein